MSATQASPVMAVEHDDVIVVGSGMAGLVCALALAPRTVTLITKTPRLEGGSSLCAKGGIAAAVGPGDTPEEHAEDTLSAGAGLSDRERALDLARAGEEALKLLVASGVPFDRTMDGALALAREAAHRRPRVVHAGGDATGRIMMAALIECVRKTPSINVVADTFVHDLLIADGRVHGVIAHSAGSGWTCRFASHVVLATGGAGMAWWHTTNPAEATGDGLAMAARAGAELSDLEFVQFHPTALAIGGDVGGASLPLLTEALRGAGARLVDAAGDRFMLSRHADAELAPRDVVAREVERQLASGNQVFLDLAPVVESGRADEFPEAFAACREAGFDATREPVPVVPAAHYHMGGVRVDAVGRTSLAGLWACGEVATTGIHGANRLASNSLLEAVVYARRVAASIHDDGSAARHAATVPRMPVLPAAGSAAEVAMLVRKARQTMSRCVGVRRSGPGLQTAASDLRLLAVQFGRLGGPSPVDAKSSAAVVRAAGEARNLLLVAQLVTHAALQREESRGAHFRDDFPDEATGWLRHQSLTLSRPQPAPPP